MRTRKKSHYSAKNNDIFRDVGVVAVPSRYRRLQRTTITESTNRSMSSDNSMLNNCYCFSPSSHKSKSVSFKFCFYYNCYYISILLLFLCHFLFLPLSAGQNVNSTLNDNSDLVFNDVQLQSTTTRTLNSSNDDNNNSSNDDSRTLPRGMLVGLNLTLQPNQGPIANCSSVEFTCQMTLPVIASGNRQQQQQPSSAGAASSSTSLLSLLSDTSGFSSPPSSSSSSSGSVSLSQTSIYWTFRGANVSASTLPGGRVTHHNSSFSTLSLDCAQFSIHNGEYSCRAFGTSSPTVTATTSPTDSANPSSTNNNIPLSSNVVSLEIFVPLRIESISPANGTLQELLDSSTAQLKCHIVGYPRPRIVWQRIDPETLTVSDIEVDGRIVIETKHHPEVQTSSLSSSTAVTSTGSSSSLLSPESSSGPSFTEYSHSTNFQSVESRLIFKQLSRSDNGSYICKANNAQPSAETPSKSVLSQFSVLVLEPPEIHIEKLEIESKSTAVVTFGLDHTGNSPVRDYTLELANYSVPNVSWSSAGNITAVSTAGALPSESLAGNNANQQQQSYSQISVVGLTPGASYGFRLSAKNDIGQSEWSYMNISVPPDVPPPIVNVHLLSKTNETFLFGWKRPAHDNGSPITKYQMVLVGQRSDSEVSNQTLVINQKGGPPRNNLMYMFHSLKPGAQYTFRVRACSELGCGEWSQKLEAATSDGHSEPPLDIQMDCKFDYVRLENSARIYWRPPTNPRGIIVGYNISLEGHSHFRNSNNRFILNQFRDSFEVGANKTEHSLTLKPNSNYTVRICALNKSGCGQLSPITSGSMCQTAPSLPSEMPNFRFENFFSTDSTQSWPSSSSSTSSYSSTSPASSSSSSTSSSQSSTFVLSSSTSLSPSSSPSGTVRNTESHSVKISPQKPRRQLKLNLPRISERNGPIKCYRIVLLRLPEDLGNFSLFSLQPTAALPSQSSSILIQPQSSHYSTSVSTNNNNNTSANNNNNNSVFNSESSISSGSLSQLERYFPAGSSEVQLSTYRAVNELNRKDSPGAYIAKELTSDSLKNPIIIGNGHTERCFDDYPEYDVRSKVKLNLPGNGGEENRTPRRINIEQQHEQFSAENVTLEDLTRIYVEDGELLANTNYSGFVEITVLTWNRTLLIARSPFIVPIETASYSLLSPAVSQSRISPTTSGIIFGTITALALILTLLFSVLCFLRRKASETGPGSVCGSNSNAFEHELVSILSTKTNGTAHVQAATNSAVGGGGGVRANGTGTLGRKSSLFHSINFGSSPSSSQASSIKKWASSPIPVASLAIHFHDRHANSDFLFHAEFDSLPESFSDRTTFDCDAPENANKNRYPDIKSYDQTRCRLSAIENVPGSDYINANFVYGPGHETKRFICAQGPLSNTIGDFWRMVSEQRAGIVVMLTGFEEQGRTKCVQYWSDEKCIQPEEYLQLTPMSRREYSDYTIRSFTLHNTITGESRDVLHFHFVAWRDFLAPEQPSWLLRFIKRVNEHHCPDRGPIVVHCSAGVGRTGTFIAIDSLIGQIDAGAEQINIFETVLILRHQRGLLVQSLKQYVFVYRAVMEYIELGDTEIEALHIADTYKELKEANHGNGLLVEFEKLNEIQEDPKTSIVGQMEVNRCKNRYDFLIPYDVNRVIVSSASNDQNANYINASFIQGYDHYLNFIVAQDPMEGTVNEFWWMIVEHNVTTLVMLAELGDGQSKCHRYWPTDEFDCDVVRVKLIEEEMRQYFIRRRFCVTLKKNNETHELNQYQFLAWKSGVVPESTLALIHLVDTVMANFEQRAASSIGDDCRDNHSPILVHCSGGGDRSSVFVAFASLVRQITTEERIDIFQTSRYIRSQRPCMLKTIAQYDFLYRCIIDYVEYHCISSQHHEIEL